MDLRVGRMFVNAPGRNGLREEIRPFEIGRDQLVEALFAGVENIGAHARGDACVVHEDVEPTEAFFRCKQEAGAVRAVRYVRLNIDGGAATLFDFIESGLDFFERAATRDYKSEARSEERRVGIERRLLQA